ncbi:MAG: heme exporter protein CcmD [Pyrinomonadaceae bacterium]
MTWQEFFSMGGYAFYVWGSYLLAALAMGGEVVLLLRRRNSLPRQTTLQSQEGTRNK